MEENLKPEEYFDVVIEDEPTEEDVQPDAVGPEEEPAAEPEPASEPEKTVPLTALQKEREKIRALKRDIAEKNKTLGRIMQGAGVNDPRDLESRMDDVTLRNYIETQGMNEDTARVFLMQQKKITDLENAQGDITYKEEIIKLKDNPYYADIIDVEDDVIDYAKSKNLTAKEAYSALYGEQRALELQKTTKAADLEEVKQSKQIAALSSSGNAAAAKNTVKLTSEEAAWAKAAGMTAAEYAKYKKMT